MSPITKQSGFALAEVLLAGLVAASIAVGLATIYARDQQNQLENEAANWMASYVNAVAAFVSRQGSVDPVGQTLPEDLRAIPFAREQVGANWLKPVDCGGAFAIADSFLSCNVPNDFLARFELPAPRVRFYWSNAPVGPLTPSGRAENSLATATTPQAVIDFGVTRASSGNPDSAIAAGIAAEINRRLEVDGYEHAEAFNIDPFVDPVATPAVFGNEVSSANLRAVVDTSIRSTVFVRIDGSTPMTGTLSTEIDDEFAMVTRDADGNEVADSINPEASLNVNDIYLRSEDTWLSEVTQIAEEAFNVAARAPSFMATVSPVQAGGTPTVVSKPTCPGTLVPEITVTPAGFIGNTPADPRLVAGVRTIANDLGGAWELGMDVFFEGSAVGFVRVTTEDTALVTVLTKCSDAP